MAKSTEFTISDFLPYLLNRAAEESSAEFARLYRVRFGLLRTEWRVLFHLGQSGEMTATEITRRSNIHKTKVSRAVSALHHRRLLQRHQNSTDRRSEFLSLTENGAKVFSELASIAKHHNENIMAQFTTSEQDILLRSLKRIIG